MRSLRWTPLVLAVAACGDNHPQNQPPVVTDLALTTAEDTALELAVTATDPEGKALDIRLGRPEHGQVTGSAGGWRYTPAADYHGPDRIVVTVNDGEYTSTGQVQLTVTPVNDPPVAGEDSFAVAEDGRLEIDFTALLANDTDIDSPTPTMIGVAPGAGGLVSMGDGRVTFVPTVDYAGDASFTYSISDGEHTAIGRVAVVVGGVNDAPVAVSDVVIGTEDRALEIPVATLLANDTDTEGQTLAIASVDDPDGGAIELDGAVVRFTPTPDHAGAAGFSYLVTDGAGSGRGSVKIHLEAVDDPPTLADGAAATDEDQALTLTLAGGDVDSATLTYAIASPPAHGAATIDGDELRYQPSANYHGADQLAVTVSDGLSTSAPAIIAVTVAGVIECGDGEREGAEACDDGNAIETDGCLSTCAAASCGDGVVQAGVEVCDDGNAIETDGCRSSCTAASCGDGVVQAGVEACDDGNAVETDGCRSSCVAAACGDGVVQTGVEACDDGNAIETDDCRSSCEAATCGDGVVQAGVEACDDGNTDDTDGCRNDCAAATCGDGFVQAGVEACDDGNANNSDACLNTCVAATCGDGVIQAGVEACDDGNSDPADACNACQPTTPPVCGDGTVNAGEECDDGNVAAQDGCSESCLDEFCGDDAVQYGLGEICDDGNTIAGDGCSATCQLEGGFTTIAPVLVSGALSCSISQSNTGRKVAVDSLGNVYVAMVCGGNAYVAASTDRGQTYGTPVDLGITGISEIAIAAGAPGTAYVAASGGGMARFTRTADAGASWAAPTDLVASSDFEISIEAFNDDVFVGIGGGSGVIVLRNDSRGVGAFTQTDVSVSQVFFDVIYDDRTDTLLVCTDTPDFHLRVSTDRGATFAPEVNPAGMAFYSDWAIGNGTIYVAGASGGSDSLILIPAASPGTSSTVAGLPYTNQSSQRALGADPVGNAYIATLLDSGAVQLDRLPFGTTTFAAPRTIAASGTYPGITALPTSTGAAMIYTSAAGGVYATIQTY